MFGYNLKKNKAMYEGGLSKNTLSFYTFLLILRNLCPISIVLLVAYLMCNEHTDINNECKYVECLCKTCLATSDRQCGKQHCCPCAKHHNWPTLDDTMAILSALLLIKKLFWFLRYFHLNIGSGNQFKVEN